MDDGKTSQFYVVEMSLFVRVRLPFVKLISWILATVVRDNPSEGIRYIRYLKNQFLFSAVERKKCIDLPKFVEEKIIQQEPPLYLLVETLVSTIFSQRN